MSDPPLGSLDLQTAVYNRYNQVEICAWAATTLSLYVSTPLGFSRLVASLPTFLAIGCGSGFPTVLVGRSSLPLPPWVTRRGAVWRGKASHRLQYGHVTPPPNYLGSGEGNGQQQQQQYIHPHFPNRPAGSMPLLLPPFCMKYSVHVWRRALQLS
jgi:hypothetical protein